MADMNDPEIIKEELRQARADLRDDVAALDHQLHVDVPARVSDYAPMITGGIAVLGLLIGFGGRKAVKGLLAAGVVAAAGAMLWKQYGPQLIAAIEADTEYPTREP